MLAIIPSMSAGFAFTESAKHVPNVVTQVSAAYCGYIGATGGNSFLDCMRDIWIPSVSILGTSTAIGASDIKAGKELEMWSLIKTGLSFLKFSAVGFIASVA